MEQRLSTSRYLGVSPARTTLSEAAMHSTHSPERYACGLVGGQVDGLARLERQVVEEVGTEDANVARVLLLNAQDGAPPWVPGPLTGPQHTQGTSKSV